MKAIITVGISASGKTTWAREYARANKAIITNRDDLRFSLTGARDWGEYKFDKKIEHLITNIQFRVANEVAELKKDFILADTNLNESRRAEWVRCLSDLGYTVEIKPFPITLEEALKRDSLRANGVGKAVIYRQWKDWLKFTGRRVYVPDTSLPKAVIFDIDGTLAHMVDRKPYDWDKVFFDALDEDVTLMLKAYVMSGYHVAFLSGRDGVCYLGTLGWIQKNLCPHIYQHNGTYSLNMREKGDMRKDTIIKEEIFWKDISTKWNVRAVFDDRPSVVRMWHDIGIPKVIAVADQNIEF